MISENLKLRLYTTLGLFLIFFLILINKFFFAYVLLICTIFAFIEFTELIKNEEIRKDATKKITIYWYKLNKLTPGKANSIPFIINFFRV